MDHATVETTTNALSEYGIYDLDIEVYLMADGEEVYIDDVQVYFVDWEYVGILKEKMKTLDIPKNILDDALKGGYVPIKSSDFGKLMKQRIIEEESSNSDFMCGCHEAITCQYSS